MTTADIASTRGHEPAPILTKVVAGVVCQAWMAILALVSVPLFIKSLGMEAFGLFGFYYTLQTVLRVLDLGMTQTVVRELARVANSDGDAGSVAMKAGTFETFFAVTGLFVGVSLTALSPLIARYWLRNDGISTETVAVCVAIMSLQCGVNWLSAFYQSALIGLERQVALYVLRMLEATLSTLGALAIIHFAGGDTRLVFLWQLGVATAGLAALFASFRRALPTPLRMFSFRMDYLRSVGGFAAGMGTITFLGVVLTNMDKVLLSRLVSLDQFGTYSVAAYSMSTLFGVLASPITNVMFPRLSSASAHGADVIHDLYHLSVQAFAVATVPVMVGVLLFARDFFEAWTRSVSVANDAVGPACWLAVGYTLNAIMAGPYLLQISQGWTAAGVRIAALLTAVFVPTLVWLTTCFGAIGAAANFAAMNAAYLMIGLALTHSRILPGRWRTVVVADIGPVAAVCAIVWAVLQLTPVEGVGIPGRLALAVAVVVFATSLSALVAGRVRGAIVGKLRCWARAIRNDGYKISREAFHESK